MSLKIEFREKIQRGSGIFANREAVMLELEICVDSVESSVAAQLGGAQRVELCSALFEGGLTPSTGLIRAVRSRVQIGLMTMIRPRGGDFYYSDEELEIMRDDIVAAREAGADGVVFGLLTKDAEIDVPRTAELVALARPMQVTFHRAIDMTPDLGRALEDVIRTGVDRILTSGGEANAMLGSERLNALVQSASDRIAVMVCGNVRPDNLHQIASSTGAREFHAALRTPAPSPVTFRNRNLSMGEPGNDEYLRYVVLPEDVTNLRKSMDVLLVPEPDTAG
jgi:copper homeostasis protein